MLTHFRFEKRLKNENEFYPPFLNQFLKMVDREEIFLWLEEADDALQKCREITEKWNNCFQHFKSQAKISSQMSKKLPQSKEDTITSHKNKFEVDLSEVDKLLAKAKSVRVVAERTVDESKTHDLKSEYACNKKNKSSKAVVDSKLSRPKTVLPKAAKNLPRERPVNRTSRSAPEARIGQKRLTGKVERGIPGLSIRNSRIQKAQIVKDNEIVPQDLGVNLQSDFSALKNEVKDNMEESCQPKLDATTSNLISNCRRTSFLKRKLSNLTKIESSEANSSRKKFLREIEEYFDMSTKSIDFSTMDNFGKLLKSRLDLSSVTDRILHSIRWETTYSNCKELQKLCDLILKYEQLRFELEFKMKISHWTKSLLELRDLTKCEKVNAYRKLYSIVIEDGDRLPTMIDDSAIDGHDEIET